MNPNVVDANGHAEELFTGYTEEDRRGWLPYRARVLFGVRYLTLGSALPFSTITVRAPVELHGAESLINDIISRLDVNPNGWNEVECRVLEGRVQDELDYRSWLLRRRVRNQADTTGTIDQTERHEWEQADR